MGNLTGTPTLPGPATWSALKRDGSYLYRSHVENAPFEKVLELFDLRATRFRGGLPHSPRSGRRTLLMLPSGRYASIENYDDFPWSLAIELQTEEYPAGRSATGLAVHMSDLMSILAPLGFSAPDKSIDGTLDWLP